MVLARRTSLMMLLALLAGFVATVAMVLAFAVAYAVALLLGRAPMPLAGDWFRGLTSNALIDTAGPVLYEATAIFFVGGLVWAVLYGVAFESRLTGPPWMRGLKFALIPWLFSLLVFMPLVGGGLLGLGLGAGPLPVVGNLILHAVYGALLGSVYGSAESVFDRPRHLASGEDLSSGRFQELGAARGMAAGLALGMVLGAAVALLVPQLGSINPLAMVIGLALTLTAFGGFVGSVSSA
jgi:hypothetical protein